MKRTDIIITVIQLLVKKFFGNCYLKLIFCLLCDMLIIKKTNKKLFLS